MSRTKTPGSGLLALFALQVASNATAGEVRMRAREHYETVEVYADTPQGNAHGTYYGFTNTIDLWYEEPYRFEIGLAGSPLLAQLYGRGGPPGFSDTIRLVHLGVEGKVFPLAGVAPAFVRVGGYAATLTTNGAMGTLQGKSWLGGVGYEWDVGGVGIAPEMDWRWAQFRGVRVTAEAPCIGVHFYKAMGGG